MLLNLVNRSAKQQRRAGTYEQRTAMGSILPKVSLKADLRQRAEELVRVKQKATIHPGCKGFNKQANAGSNLPPDFSVFFTGFTQHAGTLQSKVEPVGRGDAQLLDAALQELLPEGAVTAKYRYHLSFIFKIK